MQISPRACRWVPLSGRLQPQTRVSFSSASILVNTTPEARAFETPCEGVALRFPALVFTT